ncbi:uncharacterized protein ARMOST_15411 [Armillaria ostoyae]|uniref:Uncharacterized protein n=1 Tax=Armillaria ostoyae TaxID=47428 RepID=A0A284RTB0_ARMOS|nr:uncharacterized protein ARMOST_15411 [Armillaria ostoyae]
MKATTLIFNIDQSRFESIESIMVLHARVRQDNALSIRFIASSSSSYQAKMLPQKQCLLALASGLFATVKLRIGPFEDKEIYDHGSFRHDSSTCRYVHTTASRSTNYPVSYTPIMMPHHGVSPRPRFGSSDDEESKLILRIHLSCQVTRKVP